jgi:hypothetical protein
LIGCRFRRSQRRRRCWIRDERSGIGELDAGGPDDDLTRSGLEHGRRGLSDSRSGDLLARTAGLTTVGVGRRP